MVLPDLDRTLAGMTLAAAVKTIVIAPLALVLLLPVLMIQGLVFERQARRNEAVANIAEGWGKRQTVAGPYLFVPYERHWTEIRRETIDGKLREVRNERFESKVLRVQAASVDWTIDAEIGEKAYGIYKARLYTAKLHARGAIEVPARALRGRHQPLQVGHAAPGARRERPARHPLGLGQPCFRARLRRRRAQRGAA